MFSTIRRVVWFGALLAALSLLTPGNALAATHHSRPVVPRAHTSHVPSTAVHYHPRVPLHPTHVHGGPLGYNAYWRAVNAPNPPTLHGKYNAYWQKLQAWQQYHQRER